MSDPRPIGVFDSGVGGLSVLHWMRKIMPNESFIYYGDSANAPYGNLPQERILEIAENNAKMLMDMDVKALVIACNTATAVAIDPLRKKYGSFPIVGIEPAIKPAVESGCKKILVLATAATTKQEKFLALISKYATSKSCIIPVPCPRLASMIESGEFSDSAISDHLDSILRPHRDPMFDGIVLGCTHYPLILPIIKRLVGHEVQIFDGSEGTARRIRDLLIKNGLESESSTSPSVRLISSGASAVLDDIYARYCK